MTQTFEILEITNNFIKKVDKKAETILKSRNTELVDKIFQEQLYEQGIGGSGKSLGKYESTTIFSKQAKQQKTGNVTLRDTGDFYAGGKSIIKGTEITIFSSDSKSQILKDDWGDDIMELTAENLQDEQDIIHNDILLEFKTMFK